MSKTIRVLIVDDRAREVEQMKGVLHLAEEAHFSVDSVRSEAVKDPARVLEKFRAWQPHVILLDDKLGEALGDEDKIGIRIILPRIRAESEEVGIVIITAHRGHKVDPITRATSLGIDAFLDKPFERPELIEAVLASYQEYLRRGGKDD